MIAPEIERKILVRTKKPPFSSIQLLHIDFFGKTDYRMIILKQISTNAYTL